MFFYKSIFNDFENIVFNAFPELIEKKNELLHNGCKVVNLCGSGSALFGIK